MVRNKELKIFMYFEIILKKSDTLKNASMDPLTFMGWGLGFRKEVHFPCEDTSSQLPMRKINKFIK